MRKILALIAVATASLVAGSAVAADMPIYPEPYIEIPEVDYGLGGNFYLRGSIAGNGWWAKQMKYRECVSSCGGAVAVYRDVEEPGYGYSIGAGFGYETGDGLRADMTIDYLAVNDISDGVYDVDLRSTLTLANVYYDFPLAGVGGAGGFGAYLGAGLGVAYNRVHSEGPDPGPDGANWTAAGAVMAGVSYDMGNLVADLGYRGIYMPQITNGDAALEPPNLSPFYIDNNLIHELRGTVRYRLQ
jgi:hypothetical protein